MTTTRMTAMPASSAASFLLRMAAALALGALLGDGMAVAGAAPHPDFSGVWTYHPEPGKRAFAREKLDLPFTAEGRTAHDAYLALVGPNSDNPGAHCLGAGMPEAMTFSGAYPMEIIQRPEQITIIYEAHTEVRRLYFKGRIIAPGDRVPGRGGYSTARWEGAKLIVETDTLKDQADSIYPHGEQARIVESYHLETGEKGAKVLVNEWVLTDPATYTKPVIGTKKWLFEPRGFLLPYECDEEGWLDHLEELKRKAAAGTTAK